MGSVIRKREQMKLHSNNQKLPHNCRPSLSQGTSNALMCVQAGTNMEGSKKSECPGDIFLPEVPDNPRRTGFLLDMLHTGR